MAELLVGRTNLAVAWLFNVNLPTCNLKSEAPTPHLVETLCLSSPPAQLLPADLHGNGARRLYGWIQHPHLELCAAAQPLQLWTRQHGAVQHGVMCDPSCWVSDKNTVLPTYLRVCPCSCVFFFFFDYKVFLTVQCHYWVFFYNKNNKMCHAPALTESVQKRNES